MNAFLKGTIFSIGCLMALPGSALAATRDLKCQFVDSIDAGPSRFHFQVTNEKLSFNTGINMPVPASAKVTIRSGKTVFHYTLAKSLGIGESANFTVVPKDTIKMCSASAEW